MQPERLIPQTVLALRGSGGCSLEAGGVLAGSARGLSALIFVAIYSTWCMSRRSLSCKTVAIFIFAEQHDEKSTFLS